MPTRKAKVIPEPAEGTRSVMFTAKQVPLIRDEGDLNYVCGSCDFVLVKDANQEQLVVDIVVKCPKCGSFNEIDDLR
jgi:DNA-directed RNA polymerase subunit RPC12/RpoP